MKRGYFLTGLLRYARNDGIEQGAALHPPGEGAPCALPWTHPRRGSAPGPRTFTAATRLRLKQSAVNQKK
jgi:hypothetical protein